MATRYTKPTEEALAALDRYAAKAPYGTAERALLIFAWLADRAVVEETDGANRGPWVDLFTEGGGLDPATRPSWCALSLTWATKRAGCWSAKSALVIVWRNRARDAGRLRTKPARRLACFRLNRDANGKTTGTGHMGFVVGSALGFVRSIEGNTSPGEAGSQSNGDGLYRKNRRASWWDGYIELSQEVA